MIVWHGEDGSVKTKRCKCMDQRVSLRRIERSGMMYRDLFPSN